MLLELASLVDIALGVVYTYVFFILDVLHMLLFTICPYILARSLFCNYTYIHRASHLPRTLDFNRWNFVSALPARKNVMKNSCGDDRIKCSGGEINCKIQDVVVNLVAHGESER